jgi:Nucleotidyl transferase AbiEii toxin, Type IV TA system
MAEFFQLSTAERLDALNAAANTSGLLPHLLEKDVWVVWSLRNLFAGPYAEHLVFKGGTSLSKAYGIIRRFSEDVDLTYDIRAIAGDLVGDADTPLPASKSQEKKWTKEIRARLSGWVGAEIVPRLKLDLEQHGPVRSSTHPAPPNKKGLTDRPLFIWRRGWDSNPRSP